MYKVMDVSRYIINHLNDEGSSVSNLKLQKLLYFVQGFFLCIKDEPCFEERIEAWDFGPVVPKVYHEYKIFGANSIPSIEGHFEFSSHGNSIEVRKIIFDDSIFSDIDKGIINMVLDKLKKYSATKLVDITHNQAPWQKAYECGRNNTISNESIKECFEKGYFGNE